MITQADDRKAAIAETAYAPKSKPSTLKVSDERMDEMRRELQAQYLGTGEGEGEDSAPTDESMVEIDPLHGFVQCEACQEVLRPSQMFFHKDSECPARYILCINRSLGCREKVRLNELREHLQTDCVVERHKEEMLARCRLRAEPVVCTGCGKSVPLKDFRKHDREYCENKYVPCRNHILGCQVMVRARDRAKHEYVDGSFKQRACLYLAGGDTHLAIGEDDATGPWTAEHWVYLPSLQESVRRHIVGVLHNRKLFRRAFAKERRINLDIFALTEKMSTIVVGTGTKEEREAALQERLDTMELISNRVEEYENAAIVTVETSLSLNNSFGAALSLLNELVTDEEGEKTAALPPRPPGVTEEYAAEKQRQRKIALEIAREKRAAEIEARRVKHEEQRLAFEREVEEAIAAGKPPPVQLSEREIRLKQIRADAALAAKHKLEEEELRAALDAHEAEAPAPAVTVAAPMAVEAGDAEVAPGSSKPITAGGNEGDLTGTDNAADVTALVIDAAEEGEENKDDDEEDVDAGRLLSPTRACVELCIDPVLDTVVPISWTEWQSFVMELRDNFEKEIALLLTWRVDSGLLQTDKGHKEGHQDGETAPKKKEKGKAASEKEKARLKKEKMKKKREEKAKRAKGEKMDEPSGSQFRFRLATALKTVYGTDIINSSASGPNKLCLNIFNDSNHNNMYHVTSANIMKYPGVHHLVDVRRKDYSYPKGKVGFVSEPSGPYVFEASLPRQEWVHVAYVCHSRPRKKITLYINGEVRGQAKEHYFPLPLGAIGCCYKNTNDSFHGCLLDTRLWRKTRSSNEIKTGLHTLIEVLRFDTKSRMRELTKNIDQRDQKPDARAASAGGSPSDSRAQTADSRAATASRSGKRKRDGGQQDNGGGGLYADMTSAGMIGWWTYEDGMFDRVADVTEQRFKTIIRSSLNTRNTDQVDPAAGPAIFSYLLHDDRSADPESQITKPLSTNEIPPSYSHVWLDADFGVPLSKDAKKQAKFDAVTWEHNKHLVDGTETTPEGEEPFMSLLPIPSFKSAQVCPFELRRFRLAQKGRALLKETDCPLGCDEKIRIKDIRFHVAFACMNRIVPCRFAPVCQSTFPLWKRQSHEEGIVCAIKSARLRVLERAYVHNEELPCEFCGELIKSKEFDRHRNFECQVRTVVCPREDCGESVQARDLQDHLKYYCSSEFFQRRCWMVRRGRARKNYARYFYCTCCQSVCHSI